MIAAIMVMILLVVLFLLLAGLVVLQINSTGKPKPYLGEDGKVLLNSISEKGFVDINGGRLGFFIKGENLNNPVLLYLHGGMSDYFLTEKYPTRLDEILTIVWFEQRGSGFSCATIFGINKNINRSHLSDSFILRSSYSSM